MASHIIEVKLIIWARDLTINPGSAFIPKNKFRGGESNRPFFNPNNSYEIYYILHFPLASSGTKGDSSKKINSNIQLDFEPFVIPRPSGTPFKKGDFQA